MSALPPSTLSPSARVAPSEPSRGTPAGGTPSVGTPSVGTSSVGSPSVHASSVLAHPYVLLTITCLSWAGNTIAGRLAAGGVSPMVLTTLRWLGAVLILAALAGPHLRRDWPAIRAGWRSLALLGALGFALFNFFLYNALARTTAMNVVLIQAAIPAVVFGFSFALFGQRIAWLQAVGFLVSLAGVGLVVAGSGGGALAVGAGEWLILAGVVAYALYTACLRVKPDVHWMSALAVMAAAALATSLPLLGWEVARGAANWPSSGGEWALVAYAAVFPALVAQSCYMRAVDRIGANRAGMFVNLLPATGAVLAALVLGEAFGWREALALALGLGGIALAERGAPREAA